MTMTTKCKSEQVQPTKPNVEPQEKPKPIPPVPPKPNIDPKPPLKPGQKILHD